MRSVYVTILLLFCYASASLSSCNGKVFFESRNFFNVLHWDPVRPNFPGEKVLYSIKFLRYANEQPYQIKECQNITALHCNLTAETPSVPSVQYLAWVFVNDVCHGRTNRFTPITQTNFSKPILYKRVTVTSLHVNVTLPLGPNGTSVGDIITGSKSGPVKPSIDYTLNITSPKWAAQVNRSKTGRFVLDFKNNGTEYCGYVVYKPSFEWRESEKAHICFTLPVDPKMLLPWSLVGSALLGTVIIIAIVCSHIYITGGKKTSMPPSLEIVPSKVPKVLLNPDSHEIISKSVVCSQNDEIVYATIRVKPDVPPAAFGGYSAQDIPRIGSSVGRVVQSPTPNQQDSSSQSSEIYSSVTVHVSAEESKGLQPVNMDDSPFSKRGTRDECGSSPELTSCSAAPLPDVHSQLLLHTVRDLNGKLVLPSFNFQVRGSTDGTVSFSNPEGQPLLSDLIDSKEELSLASLQCLDSSEWSDSGCDESTVNTPTQPYCNTHCFPTQVTPSLHLEHQNSSYSHGHFESGYKPNWIDEISLGGPCKDNCDYDKVKFPWTFTGPEEGGDEEVQAEQILLRNWVVTFQD
ncbi:interferon lambda receptor 1 [Aulostomus maculatus]